jgi:hypothetical protein
MNIYSVVLSVKSFMISRWRLWLVTPFLVKISTGILHYQCSLNEIYWRAEDRGSATEHRVSPAEHQRPINSLLGSYLLAAIWNSISEVNSLSRNVLEVGCIAISDKPRSFAMGQSYLDS